VDAEVDAGDAGADVAPEGGGADVAEAAAVCPSGIVTVGQTATPMYGGTAGTPYTDTCPTSEVVIGFTGYTTTTSPIVVGSLQTLCGKLSFTSPSCQVTVSPGTTLTVRGHVGGMGPWTSMCPANQMVVAFHGRAGFDLDQVAFECAPLVLSKMGSSYRLSTGPVTSLPPEGGTTGPVFQDGCGTSQVAVGTRGHEGAIIYDLGLLCATPAVTP